MTPVVFGAFHVWVYDSMLQTRAAWLKEVYCESHRQERWLFGVEGPPQGRCVFPHVLYIRRDVRDGLLRDYGARLLKDGQAAAGLMARVDTAARTAMRLIHAVERGEDGAATLEALYLWTARALSVGAVKEVLTPEALEASLSRWLPRAMLPAALLPLHHSACLPHMLRFEAKLLFHAARLGRGRRREAQVRAACHQASWLGRFDVEQPLDVPEEMEKRLMELARLGRPALEARRNTLLAQHAARRGELMAWANHLVQRADVGQHLSHAQKGALRGLVKLSVFSAAWEELKHMLVLRAGRAVRAVVERRGLALEEGTQVALVALTSRAGGTYEKRTWRPRTGSPSLSSRRRRSPTG